VQRSLFIHAGPTKTGTSAIQDALRRHDNSIVIYPKVGLWADGSHHNLVLNFYGDSTRPEVVREDSTEQFARIAAEARQSRRDLIISSEVLGGRQKPGLFIRALLDALGPEFSPQILVCVREHFERAASVYNQRVKDAVTCEQRSPDEFLTQQSRNLVYAPLVRKFRRAGLPVKTISYHPAADLVPRMLAELGFGGEAREPAANRNVSLAPKALIATLAANRVARSEEERDHIFDLLRHMPGFYGTSQFIFSNTAAALAQPGFDEDRRFLEKRFDCALPAPQLPETATAFAIGNAEYDDIAQATAGLGELRCGLLDQVRLHLHSSGS
jgi:hypothetical protein